VRLCVQDMVIHVCYPKHCSALKWLPSPCKIPSNCCFPREEGTERNNNTRNNNKINESFALILHFNRDRIVWNVIRPWIEARESKHLDAAVGLIMTQFSQFMYPISNEYSLECNIVHDGDHVNTPMKDNHGMDNEEYSSMEYDWRCRDVHITNVSKMAKKKQRRNVSKACQIYLFFVPPYPSPLSKSTLYTEKLFTKALVRLENMQIRLQSLNAYVATLGGGYFLCRFLSTAISLANYQRRLALALGDYSLAMKCTINEAYNYIHAGMTKQANHLIKQTWKDAKARNDVLIISMCRSAKWFSDRVAEAQLRDDAAADDDGDNGRTRKVHKKVSSSGIHTLTIDDYQRIRIVRNRNLSELFPKSHNTVATV
jgi:hypothetical protein